MDHFGPWIVIAVIAIGWAARAARGIRRFAVGLSEATAEATAEARARARAAELARGRARPRPASAPAPQPAPRVAAPVPGNVRTTAPTRRVPLAAARPGGPLPDTDETPRSAGGRALADALRNPAGLRNAVVLAELLAPPVALR
jgi:hypothetical protein